MSAKELRLDLSGVEKLSLPTDNYPSTHESESYSQLEDDDDEDAYSTVKISSTEQHNTEYVGQIKGLKFGRPSLLSLFEAPDESIPAVYKLSDSVLERIFSKLNAKSLFVVCYVCKRWRSSALKAWDQMNLHKLHTEKLPSGPSPRSPRGLFTEEKVYFDINEQIFVNYSPNGHIKGKIIGTISARPKLKVSTSCVLEFNFGKPFVIKSPRGDIQVDDIQFHESVDTKFFVEKIRMIKFYLNPTIAKLDVMKYFIEFDETSPMIGLLPIELSSLLTSNLDTSKSNLEVTVKLNKDNGFDLVNNSTILGKFNPSLDVNVPLPKGCVSNILKVDSGRTKVFEDQHRINWFHIEFSKGYNTATMHLTTQFHPSCEQRFSGKIQLSSASLLGKTSPFRVLHAKVYNLSGKLHQCSRWVCYNTEVRSMDYNLTLS